MQITEVTSALGAPAEQTVASGVYVWAADDGSVLYVGESRNVDDRVSAERRWAREFRAGYADGGSLDIAGCGLAVVLSRAGCDRVHRWPVSNEVERKATQNALIRLAALQGATPPAQGAGWDYYRERTATAERTNALVSGWLHSSHDIGATSAAERSALLEAFDRLAAVSEVLA